LTAQASCLNAASGDVALRVVLTLSLLRFSQLLEKNALTIQLSDTSQRLHETQHHYSELFKCCAVLEKQVQELQVVSQNVDATLGAPLENDGTCKKNDSEATREPHPSVPEAQQELYNTQQEVSELKKLLEEERNRRLSTENRLSLAEEQIKWLTQRERESARTPITGAYGSQETTVLIDIPGISCQVTRSHAGCKRVLCSLCRSRTQMPVFAAIYFLLVHVLFILCITGYL
ncbi:golgin subfamily B member 1-like, partial [Onychomys torridus]|uniref:golgin subfamily B member 1-like n=1 Tax=Onychomys torridus TaxID=38674 RepID=UPI00167F98FD